ncbi:MAG: hypothetical protein ACLUPV_05480 [Bilophila wadsworthia]
MQQFSPWIAGFPGLIWSIDIPHSRLKVFNRWSIPGLDVPRLLKDARYRKKAVRREDHALLMEFWDMLTARRPAAVTFRLTNGNGTYILQGWPGENDTLYYGFLKEAFLPAAYSADGRPGTCQMDIGGIGYPVFALDIPTRGLLIINDAARSLFAAASRDPNTLGLADIAPGGLAEKLLEAGNKALANDAWAGTLTFSNAQRGLFSAKVRLTPCGGAGEGRVVRVALLNIPENRKSAACPPSEEDAQTAPRPLREGWKAFSPLRRRAGRPPFPTSSPTGAGRRVSAGPAFRELRWGGTRLRRHHRTGHRTLRPALAHRGGYAGQHQVHRLGAVRPTRHPLLFRQTVLYGAGPARHPHPRQHPPRFLRRGCRNPLRQPHGAF